MTAEYRQTIAGFLLAGLCTYWREGETFAARDFVRIACEMSARCWLGWERQEAAE